MSAQYGFWLGDAFASGGSNGYDHKKEGITARGAWECVKHHFRNLGMDVQTQPFTMAGIGDMAGDVFGNGALRAAGDEAGRRLQPPAHLPRPRPRPGEQLRGARAAVRAAALDLARLRRGAHQRGRRHLRPLRQGHPAQPAGAQAARTSSAESASGEEVIRRILTAEVDLLYNGGIGTYVKASTEEDAEVGDRANDRVRVDGDEVRARVVGEGGNLGFTQQRAPRVLGGAAA